MVSFHLAGVKSVNFLAEVGEAEQAEGSGALGPGGLGRPPRPWNGMGLGQNLAPVCSINLLVKCKFCWAPHVSIATTQHKDPSLILVFDSC